MKFTKEQVLEQIKATLGKTQKLSDRTILDTVTNTMALFSDDVEMELDAFIAKVSPIVKSMNDNLNKEQSDFVKEWKEKNPVPKKGDDEGSKGNGGDEMPQWYKDEVERRMKMEQELQAKLDAITTGKKVESLRASALTKFKEDLKEELDRNPKIAARMEKRYSKVLENISDTDDEQSLIARLTEEFNDAKDFAGDSYIPSDGTGGGGSSTKAAGADDSAVNDALQSLGVAKPADNSGSGKE